MSTFHDMMADSQKKFQALADEIEVFTKARILNQKAADGLEAASEALRQIVKEIRPLNELRMRRFLITIVSLSVFNTMLFDFGITNWRIFT